MFGSVRCGLARRTLIDLFCSGRTVKHHFGRSLVSRPQKVLEWRAPILAPYCSVMGIISFNFCDFFVTRCWKNFHLTCWTNVTNRLYLTTLDYMHRAIQLREQPNKDMLVFTTYKGVIIHKFNFGIWFGNVRGNKIKSNLPVWNATSSCTYSTCIHNACVLSKACTTNRLKFVDGWSSPDLCVRIIR